MGRRRKRMEQERLPLGTIYQTKEGGNYYLRYQIQGRRKNVNLNTSDYAAALKEYQRLLPTLQATTVEVVAAHVKVARRLGAPEKRDAHQGGGEEDNQSERACAHGWPYSMTRVPNCSGVKCPSEKVGDQAANCCFSSTTRLR